jgi:hypothetical protein
MGTSKRRPIHRSLVMQITPRAVELYRQMCRVRCVCPPREYGDRYVPLCANCERWYDLHNELHLELKLKPWQWPAIPSISGGGREGAEELEQELAAALKRQRQMERVIEEVAEEVVDPVVASDPAGAPSA